MPAVRRRSDNRIAQHTANCRNGQSFEVECAGCRWPLGKKHPPLLVEGDLGDFRWTGSGRRREFDHGIAVERAVGFQADRPDLQAVGHCVIKPVLVDGEAEDAALGRRIVPGRGRVLSNCGLAISIALPANSMAPAQPLRRAASDAVVVTAEFMAVHPEAMNEIQSRGRRQKAIWMRRRRRDRRARRPELLRPSSITSANRLTLPVVPSIFQIDPGPPCGPHRPRM